VEHAEGQDQQLEPTSEPASEQVTVTLPRSALAQLQEAAAAAVPAAPARPKLTTEQSLARLEELRGGRPLPEHAIVWARRALGLDDDSAGPGPARARS
jgi:hypothetical protein